MKFLIRTPISDDAPMLLALISMPEVYSGFGLPPHTPLRYIRERLETRDPNCHMIVGAVDGEVVAWATMFRKTGRRSHCANLEILVRPDHWGKGIGRKMLTDLIETADRWLGITRLELPVIASNVRAIRLYESFGFEHEGTRRQAMMTNGKLEDMHMMARLRPAPGPASPSG